MQKKVALALLLPVWVAASGCSLLPTEREPVSVVVAPAASSETTYTVRKGSIQQVMTLNALVTSRQSADLFYPVDERLKTLYVKPGDQVNGGQLLAETFDDDASYQLAVAQIRLQQAQFALETAQRQAGNADVVQATIRQRELDLSVAQLTVQHYQARVAASRLVSPIGGKVIRVNVKPGEVVGAFQTVIAVANPGDLRARVLQFGVLQAMGLSLGQLVRALALEQVITAGLGIGLGTGIGMGVTALFVPFLQQGTGRDQVPPFRVIMDPGDRLRLYLVMGFMLLVGLAGLVMTLRRLRVHEALKLGEDQ